MSLVELYSICATLAGNEATVGRTEYFLCALLHTLHSAASHSVRLHVSKQNSPTVFYGLVLGHNYLHLDEPMGLFTMCLFGKAGGTNWACLKQLKFTHFQIDFIE